MPLPLTYARALWRRAERDPRSELLRVAGGAPWSADDVRARAASWAIGLAPIAPGDVVVTRVDSSPEAVALTAAISALGAVELPFAPDTPAEWASHISGLMHARAIVSSTEYADTPLVRRLTQTVTGHRLELVDGPDRLGTNLPGADRLVPATVSADAPALAAPTSGTTGRRKVALLPVGAPIRQARQVAAALQYGRHDVLLSLFPWQHINARNAVVLPAIISDARVVFAPRFSASGFWELVRRERVTAFNFMGALCMMLLRQPPSPDDRNHTVTKAYGGPAPADLVDAFADRFGVTLRQAYACTELGDIATTTLDELLPGAAGRPLDDRQVRVVDRDLRDVPDGATGEILVRPRHPGTALLEYVGDPGATAAAWESGWFRTRDRGQLANGWLHITGRTSDVIRRRGVNLDPQQVEEALLTHPAVIEAAAIAVPSELTEDEILALVVTGPDAPTPETLWQHCRSMLPRSGVPRYLSLVPALPHTTTHKLDRATLRRRGLPADAWDAEAHTLTPEAR